MLARTSRLLTLLLGALAALGPLSMDIYLVSMPSMTTALNASVAEVQLTLSVYMLGFGLGQFMYGPLSDRFGRRPGLIGGLLLYVFAALAATQCTTVATLVMARFFQAIGMCSALVVSRAVVRDLHTREGAARIFSYMQIVAGFAPIAAPIIGSHVHVHFGWQANFVLVATYGLMLLVTVVFFLPETNDAPDPSATRPATYLHNLRLLARSRAYVGYVLTIGFMSGGLFAFLSASSYVFLRVFDFPESSFGYLFGFCMLGNLFGAGLSSRLVMRYRLDRMLSVGLVLAIVSGAAMAGLSVAGVDHVATILVPMFLYMMAFQFVFPQAMAGALSPFPHIAGYASSMLGLLQFALPAGIGMGVAAAFDGTPRPMAGAILAMGVMATLAYRMIVGPRPGSA